MIRLTTNGKFCLGLCALLYFASLTSHSSLLLLLDGILLGACAVNFTVARRALRSIDLHAPRRAYVTEGQRLSQSWKIENRSRRRIGWLRVDSPAGVWIRVPELAPESDSSVVPEIQFPKRGVFPLFGIRLACGWPFGLVEAIRKIELPGEVVVVPAVYAADPPAAAGFDVMLGGRHHGGRRIASGADFAGVQPLQPGDPIKRVHWKASAKGLGLMVKVFDEELSGRVAILTAGGQGGNERSRDDSIRAAGSLIFAALDAGHHVEWLDLATNEVMLLPPFADGETILDRLAQLPSGTQKAESGHTRQAVERFSRKSAVAMVVTELSDEILECVRELQGSGRPVALYVPETTPSSSIPVGVTAFEFRTDGIERMSRPEFGSWIASQKAKPQMDTD